MCQSLSSNNEMVPMTPHQYPIWVMVFSGLILFVLLFSLTSVPSSITAGKRLNEAQRFYEQGFLKKSIDAYTVVLANYPNSEKARFGAAEANFRLHQKQSDEKALELLDGVTLNKEKIARLREVMPQEYWKFFHSSKETTK